MMGSESRKIDSMGGVSVVVDLLVSLVTWSGSDEFLLRKEMTVCDGWDGHLWDFSGELLIPFL